MSEIEYYAVTRGRTLGLFTDWESCCNSIERFPSSSYKVFNSLDKAKEYLDLNGIVSKDLDMFLDDLKKEFDISSEYGIEELAYAINGAFNSFEPKMDKDVFADGTTKKVQDSKYNEAAFGVYFGDHDERNLFGKVPFDSPTDQVADLYAVYTALKIIIDSVIFDSFDFRYRISTFSRYSIKYITGLSDAYDPDQWMNSQGIPFELQELLVDTVTLYDLLNLLYKNCGWPRMYIHHAKTRSDTKHSHSKRSSYERQHLSSQDDDTRVSNSNSTSYYPQETSDNSSYKSANSNHKHDRPSDGSQNGAIQNGAMNNSENGLYNGIKESNNDLYNNKGPMEEPNISSYNEPVVESNTNLYNESMSRTSNDSYNEPMTKTNNNSFNVQMEESNNHLYDEPMEEPNNHLYYEPMEKPNTNLYNESMSKPNNDLYSEPMSKTNNDSYHGSIKTSDDSSYNIGMEKFNNDSYTGRLGEAELYYNTQNVFNSNSNSNSNSSLNNSQYEKVSDRGKLSTAIKYGNYYRKAKKKGKFGNSLEAIMFFIKAIYYYRHYKQGKKCNKKYKKGTNGLINEYLFLISNYFSYILLIGISVLVIWMIHMFSTKTKIQNQQQDNNPYEYRYNYKP